MDRVKVKYSDWVGLLRTLGVEIAEEAFGINGTIIEVVDPSGKKINEYIIEKKEPKDSKNHSG